MMIGILCHNFLFNRFVAYNLLYLFSSSRSNDSVCTRRISKWPFDTVSSGNENQDETLGGRKKNSTICCFHRKLFK